MIAYELENIATWDANSIDYICVIWNMTRNDAVNRLNNSEVDDMGSLWIWTLVQIKHQ